MEQPHWHVIYTIRSLAIPWILWLLAIVSIITFVSMTLVRYNTLHNGQNHITSPLIYTGKNEKMVAIVMMCVATFCAIRGYIDFHHNQVLTQNDVVLFDGIISTVQARGFAHPAKGRPYQDFFLTINNQFLLWPFSQPEGCVPRVGDHVRIWYSPSVLADFTGYDFSALRILKLEMMRPC